MTSAPILAMANVRCTVKNRKKTPHRLGKCESRGSFTCRGAAFTCRGGGILAVKSSDNQVAALQFVVVPEKKIPETRLKILGRFLNSLRKIRVVRPDESISEIVGIFGENLVVHRKAKGTQILDGEYGCRARVAFTPQLPNARPCPDRRGEADPPFSSLKYASERCSALSLAPRPFPPA